MPCYTSCYVVYLYYTTKNNKGQDLNALKMRLVRCWSIFQGLLEDGGIPFHGLQIGILVDNAGYCWVQLVDGKPCLCGDDLCR